MHPTCFMVDGKSSVSGSFIFMKVGDVYFFFTIISEPYNIRLSGKTRKYVDVRCVCGKEKRVPTRSLLDGSNKSCKCKRLIFKDRLKTNKMRNSFRSMHNRCGGDTEKHKRAYLDRGITVCEEWGSFPRFYEDMQEGWALGLELDRINNNKGYFKDNCRWVTEKEQGRNTRTTKITEQDAIDIRKSSVSYKELMNKYNLSNSQISRIKTNKRWIL